MKKGGIEDKNNVRGLKMVQKIFGKIKLIEWGYDDNESRKFGLW